MIVHYYYITMIVLINVLINIMHQVDHANNVINYVIHVKQIQQHVQVVTPPHIYIIQNVIHPAMMVIMLIMNLINVFYVNPLVKHVKIQNLHA